MENSKLISEEAIEKIKVLGSLRNIRKITNDGDSANVSKITQKLHHMSLGNLKQNQVNTSENSKNKLLIQIKASDTPIKIEVDTGAKTSATYLQRFFF